MFQLQLKTILTLHIYVFIILFHFQTSKVIFRFDFLSKYANFNEVTWFSSIFFRAVLLYKHKYRTTLYSVEVDLLNQAARYKKVVPYKKSLRDRKSTYIFYDLIESTIPRYGDSKTTKTMKISAPWILMKLQYITMVQSYIDNNDRI